MPSWKRRISNHEVKRLEPPVCRLEPGQRQRVILHNFRRRAAVQKHVHLGKNRRGVVHLLAVQGEV